VAYAVRRRGSSEVAEGPYRADELGGVTDRSYRRQEAYAGMGAKLKRIQAEMARRGVVVAGPRPPVLRSASRTERDAHGEASDSS